MKKPRVKLVLSEVATVVGARVYRVEALVNTTDWSIGQTLKQGEVDRIIWDGVEVTIRGRK